MNADLFDGATLMAIEVAGTALIFLCCVVIIAAVMLALFIAGKCVEALVRFAVRQIRAKAFASPRSEFYPATLGATTVRPVFHVDEDL